MPGHRKRRQFKQTDAFTRGMVIGLKRAVIVAVYACGLDVEKGPIRQQLWNAPPCDNVESWPLIREAFTIIGRPPDLQGWVFGHGLDDDALAILASAKTRIYRHFLGAELRSVQEDPLLVWRRTLSRMNALLVHSVSQEGHFFLKELAFARPHLKPIFSKPVQHLS
ncbi:hypothetical protein LAZ67_2001939 [Cordylochernes scorpioides]|uniref:Uncharacterized protein n=1 Tax=Cordylochernes scorpioides TaxID=51811 RepID=A0ABY6K1N2_9ARAC|nr:hypothetical protein LAZ67_2001939 [Cordylochernes scorpioides]